MAQFNPLKSVTVTIEDVRYIREARECGLMEAKRAAQGLALARELANMRYRTGKYEDKSTDDILNDIIELLMNSIEY